MSATRHVIATALAAVVSVALAVFVLIGCERRDENAASIQASINAQKDEQNANPATSRPTTQQLLQGPTRRIALVVMPLTVEAPESWQVKTLSVGGTNADATSPGSPGSGLMPGGAPQQPAAGSMSFTELTGPAPAGDVHVQLAMRMPWTSDRLDRMLKAAQRDADKQRGSNGATTAAATDTTSGALLKFDIRQQGSTRVMEQQKVMVAPDGGAKVMDWRLTYFVPRTGANALSSPAGSAAGAGEYDACELNFLGLTLDQFDRDQAFLQKIIDSVRSDPAGLTVTQPMSTDPLTKPPAGQ